MSTAPGLRVFVLLDQIHNERTRNQIRLTYRKFRQDLGLTRFDTNMVCAGIAFAHGAKVFMPLANRFQP